MIGKFKEEITFLYKKECGKIEDLLERFSEEEINQLEILGKIRYNYVLGRENEWMITKQIREDYDLFCKTPNFLESVIGYAMSALGLRMQI